MLQVIDNEQPVVLWAAEEPFMFQLMAALRKMGKDVQPQARTEVGKARIMEVNPKVKVPEALPQNYKGVILWAPKKELFTDSPLDESSMVELQQIATQNTHVVAALPQRAFAQVLNVARVKFLFFPTVVGFGDENLFENTLRNILKSKVVDPHGFPKAISIPDAVSFFATGAMSLRNFEKLPNKTWVEGIEPTLEDFSEGFNEAGTVRTIPSFVEKIISKFSKKSPAVPNAQPTAEVALAKDFFPVSLTPWKRFFRDSWRIYNAAPEGKPLLHFPPSRAL